MRYPSPRHFHGRLLRNARPNPRILSAHAPQILPAGQKLVDRRHHTTTSPDGHRPLYSLAVPSSKGSLVQVPIVTEGNVFYLLFKAYHKEPHRSSYKKHNNASLAPLFAIFLFALDCPSFFRRARKPVVPPRATFSFIVRRKQKKDRTKMFKSSLAGHSPEGDVSRETSPSATPGIPEGALSFWSCATTNRNKSSGRSLWKCSYTFQTQQGLRNNLREKAERSTVHTVLCRGRDTKTAAKDEGNLHMNDAPHQR
jgi:hypothetical protein